MTIPREAVEAAVKAYYARGGWSEETEDRIVAALTAALPFLAPQPSQGDEELAHHLVCEIIAGGGTDDEAVNVATRLIAAVRAEEREATKRDLVSNTQEFVRDAISSLLAAKDAEIAWLKEVGGRPRRQGSRANRSPRAAGGGESLC
jgi:hypothetical protein